MPVMLSVEEWRGCRPEPKYKPAAGPRAKIVHRQLAQFGSNGRSIKRVCGFDRLHIVPHRTTGSGMNHGAFLAVSMKNLGPRAASARVAVRI
ncbi:hypothetical protein [Bradyrhizobium ottawaense]|uniref:hypothetical protein n=1 Tax=Bradyrhizobium ottawaense TaxID=931866 RepID=UPI001455881D